MIEQICNQEECTGCFACMNACPHNAIESSVDENGKTVPKIKEDVCIECGLCKKICPVNSHVKKQVPYECYAAWTKNKKNRKIASSGGMAIEFSEYFVENAGVVYGSAFTEKFQLEYRRAETFEEIERFCGSKYVQSYIGMSYRDVKKDLESGKQVLFIGTPCQIAGVKAYLQKDYEKLLTVDLLCHGTPPMKYLKEYTDGIVGEGRATEVSFRGKRDYQMTIYEGERVLYSKRHRRDPYYVAFLQGLINRDNCYSCNYACVERCSDITIGDFWGIDRKGLKKQYKGKISLLLINTDKGVQAWKSLQDRFEFEERKISEAVKGNAPLRNSCSKHTDREIFLKDYREKGFENAVKTKSIEIALEKAEVYDNLFHRVAGKIRKVLR